MASNELLALSFEDCFGDREFRQARLRCSNQGRNVVDESATRGGVTKLGSDCGLSTVWDGGVVLLSGLFNDVRDIAFDRPMFDRPMSSMSIKADVEGAFY